MPPINQAFREVEAQSEVPVGAAMLALHGTMLANADNRTEADADASAHAEMLALRAVARRLGRPHLIGCDLVVMPEASPMCAAVLSHFPIRCLVFGAYDPRAAGGSTGLACSRKRIACTVRRWWAECGALLRG